MKLAYRATAHIMAEATEMLKTIITSEQLRMTEDETKSLLDSLVKVT